jgi:hypothetical protein
MARALLRLVLSIPPSTVPLSGALLTPGSIRLRTTAWRILGETPGAEMNQRTRLAATNNLILNVTACLGPPAPPSTSPKLAGLDLGGIKAEHAIEESINQVPRNRASAIRQDFTKASVCDHRSPAAQSRG